MLRFALIGLVLAAAGGQPAQACSLPIFAYEPEPPGLSPEESRQFQEEAEASWRWRELLAHQYRVWSEADAVLLARIESLQPNSISLRDGDVIEVRDVVLEPVQWLKGSGPEAAFRIGPKRFTSCGAEPFWEALNGVPGDMHVVYIGGAPSQETVLDVIPVADVKEFQTKSRLPPPQ